MNLPLIVLIIVTILILFFAMKMQKKANKRYEEYERFPVFPAGEIIEKQIDKQTGDHFFICRSWDTKKDIIRPEKKITKVFVYENQFHKREEGQKIWLFPKTAIPPIDGSLLYENFRFVDKISEEEVTQKQYEDRCKNLHNKYCENLESQKAA